jgi:hypothetical protein
MAREINNNNPKKIQGVTVKGRTTIKERQKT